MGKLLVLSEIDCRDFLKSRGIFPDEFYTDFVLFRNKSASFTGCDVFILFAGSCHFSKRHVLDIIKTLKRRAANEKDNGINSVTVFTDVFLPTLDKYYKYQGKLSNISEYSHWKLIEKASPVWSQVPKGSGGTDLVSYLTDYDRGEVDSLKETYIKSLEGDSALRALIQKPNFSYISEF